MNYTSNLQLPNPTPGDPTQRNAWGTTENTGRTLVDQAVGGTLSLSVAGSSDVVLTSTAGAPDQSRYANYVFTGALTGNINIFWPLGLGRKFSAINQTTGGFEITLAVTNGSGAAAGDTAPLPAAAMYPSSYVSDGTNVDLIDGPVNEVTPEMFGCIGDGTSDCYAGLHALAAYVNTGVVTKVTFGAGKTYFIAEHIESGNGITSIQYTDVDGITIEGNGATIQSAGGFNRAAASTSTVCPLWFVGCTNLIVRNLTAYGSSDTITKNGGVGEASDGYGFKLQGCKNVLIENVICHYWITDGFLYDYRAGSPYIVCQNVTMLNVKSTYNARQGVSVTGLFQGTFIGCNLDYTGKSSYGFHAPSSGIDIEPDTLASKDFGTGDILLLGCTLNHNHGSILNINNPVIGVTFLQCQGICDVADAPTFAIGADGAEIRFLYNNFECGVSRCTSGTSSNTSDAMWIGNTISGSGIELFGVSNNMRVTADGNKIICNSATPIHNQRLVTTDTTTMRFTNNYIFNPATAYSPRNGTDDTAFCADLQNALLIAGNRWDTDLVAADGPHGAACYVADFETPVLVQNETFLGPERGTSASFRPDTNGSFNTLFPFSQGVVTVGISALATSSVIIRTTLGAAAPASGAWVRGDRCLNISPSELGTAGAKYVIAGWICTVAGSPGTWLQMRTLTGN